MRGLFHTAGKDYRAPHLPNMQMQHNRMPEMQQLRLGPMPNLPASTGLCTANITQDIQSHRPAVGSSLLQAAHSNSITAS